jgi:hypothetical protein
MKKGPLWVLKPNPFLIIVFPETIAIHVPKDSGYGHWQVVQIPFLPFI